MDQNVRPPVVLVVEDEPLVRLYAAETFHDHGFTVMEAGNGVDALGLLESHADIEAVFTDVNMPGSLDGLELAQTVGQRWPEVPVVVTSGKVSAESAELPALGRFVKKPYDAEAVVGIIQELLA